MKLEFMLGSRPKATFHSRAWTSWESNPPQIACKTISPKPWNMEAHFFETIIHAFAIAEAFAAANGYSGPSRARTYDSLLKRQIL